MANNSALLGLESRLWEAADTLRGSMDAAEYKHVVLPAYPLVPLGSRMDPSYINWWRRQ